MGICQGWRAEPAPQGQGREVPGRQEGTEPGADGQLAL